MKHDRLQNIKIYDEPEEESYKYNKDVLLKDDDIYLRGYFQNERYFKEYKKDIWKKRVSNY